MRKALRYLRIAFSVTCGILCLLLIGLWVRSYYRNDHVFITRIGSYALHIESSMGLIKPFVYDAPGPFWMKKSEWKVFTPMNIIGPVDWYKWDARPRAWNWVPMDDGEVFAWPHWFPALVASLLAAAPWLRWRFSLRTLLIAMTLVAVGLELVVYALRS